MLTRRLHILVDEERFRRIEREAKSRKISVAEVIREAVDRSLPATWPDRKAAGEAILSATTMPVPLDPADLRRELADARDRFER